MPTRADGAAFTKLRRDRKPKLDDDGHCANARCTVVLTRVFSAMQGYCTVCGRRWGHGGTPISQLRGSLQTGFGLRVPEDPGPSADAPRETQT